MAVTKFENKVTYGEINTRIQEQIGWNIQPLYIAQVKREHGIIKHECNKKLKSESVKILISPLNISGWRGAEVLSDDFMIIDQANETYIYGTSTKRVKNDSPTISKRSKTTV